ncbi:MAG: hypothetical protein ACLFSB_12590 [Chitinispirillaceae bacterium]
MDENSYKLCPSLHSCPMEDFCELGELSRLPAGLIRGKQNTLFLLNTIFQREVHRRRSERISRKK